MMESIRVEQSFVLYARCSVNYEGRAKSTLESGNHLVIHKNDGTLLIHGGSLCTPLNYQPPGAILNKKGDKLISTRKDEKIVITIEQIISYQELSDWSSKKIDIHQTEKELQNYIAENVEKVLSIKPIEVHTEFATPVGNIDVLVIDSENIYHIIEVKRKTASLAACSQLERYANYFIDIGKTVKDYLASPKISSNALKYCQEFKQTWVQIDYQVFES